MVHGQIMVLLMGGFAEEIPTNDPLLKGLKESFQFSSSFILDIIR